MSNDWYNQSGWPSQSASGDSASARSELSSIQAAFNKAAPIIGMNLRLVRVNAAGNAQESVTPQTATLETYADAQAGTHTHLSGVAGSNAITAQATPTLTAYVVDQLFTAQSAAANTAAVTINIDGVGVAPLHRPDGSALQIGDIPAAGYPLQLWVRAADVVLVNPYFGVEAPIAASASKGTPVGADSVAGIDSVTGLLARFTWTNIVTYLSGLCSAGWNAFTSSSCSGNSATATTATNLSGTPGFFAPIIASLGADVALNNTANYFDGPSIAQGVVGKWFVSGAVAITDTSAGVAYVKLWDGTSVIASAPITISAPNQLVVCELSGMITTPAGNLRLSVRDITNTTGKIIFNQTGNAKDSTITAVRVG